MVLLICFDLIVLLLQGGLPNPDDFSKALYIFDIGQNDLTFAFRNLTGEQILGIIPQTMNEFAQVVQVRIIGLAQMYMYIHTYGSPDVYIYDNDVDMFSIWAKLSRYQFSFELDWKISGPNHEIVLTNYLS